MKQFISLPLKTLQSDGFTKGSRVQGINKERILDVMQGFESDETYLWMDDGTKRIVAHDYDTTMELLNG